MRSLMPKPRRPKLIPSLTLSAEEKKLFAQIAADNPHLMVSDAPLVTQYVLILTRVKELSRDKDVRAWDKAVRLALQTGTKLRILPQSTVDPVTSGRRKADVHANPLQKPWWETRGNGDEFFEDNDDDSEGDRPEA
jgi:hypothetical protein